MSMVDEIGAGLDGLSQLGAQQAYTTLELKVAYHKAPQSSRASSFLHFLRVAHVFRP
ncbi:hypothetical protein D3C84_1134950 [compost metagenome]